MAKVCDFCNQPIRLTTGECTVSKDGNDFHEHCWDWMERQKRIHNRRAATGATFTVLHPEHGKRADEA